MGLKEDSACRLIQHKVEGHHSITMENEWFRVSIDTDQGAHIFEMIDKRTNINVLYKDPKGLAAHDIGGWYELFPNAGSGCSFKDSDIPVHGDVQRLPWKFRIVQEDADELQVLLWTESKARPFALEKTIRLQRSQSNLYISEKITNLSKTAEPYLWGQHITFGPPFLSSCSRIDLPVCHVYNQPDKHPAESRLSSSSSGTLDAMPGKQGELVDITYFPNEPSSEMLFIDELQDHWYNVFNEQEGLGFAIAWDRQVFPYLWLWQVHHSVQQDRRKDHVYVMALEPQSSNVPILTNAAAEGKAPILMAGQSVEAWQTVVMHHTREHVKFVTKAGKLIFKQAAEWS
jgi:galactose mutarotase-like enzyme